MPLGNRHRMWAYEEYIKEYDILKASRDKLVEALEKIRDLETDCCPRCEGNGRLWADGKVHLPSYQGDTINCGNCGGSGRLLPEDAIDIAIEALKEVGEIK